MKIKIEHTLLYNYSQPVILEPHTLFLFPKVTGNKQLINHELYIEPLANFISQNIDIEGNNYSLAFFENYTEALQIKSTVELIVIDQNPFQYIIHPYTCSNLPFEYPNLKKERLQIYLDKSLVNTLIEQEARDLAAKANWKTTAFVTQLCRYINQNFGYQSRETGYAQTPENTLLSKSGSCRDFTMLFIGFCRAMGIAARFVSGYYYAPSLPEHQLHAWAEVYLPGAGWRGFDPTLNIAVGARHIALAASAFAEAINPVIGSFRGNATSGLTTNLVITEI